MRTTPSANLVVVAAVVAPIALVPLLAPGVVGILLLEVIFGESDASGIQTLRLDSRDSMLSSNTSKWDHSDSRTDPMLGIIASWSVGKDPVDVGVLERL